MCNYSLALCGSVAESQGHRETSTAESARADPRPLLPVRAVESALGEVSRSPVSAEAKLIAALTIVADLRPVTTRNRQADPAAAEASMAIYHRSGGRRPLPSPLLEASRRS